MVTVEDLCFGYRTGTMIYDRLSHQFPAGAVTGVTGASGSGKSTLLYLIGLLLTPSGGRIMLDGLTDASRLGDRRRSELRARHIGFVFQDALLDPSRSVLDNVLEGAMYADLDRTVATDRAHALLRDFGVRIPVDRRPGEISGGQAQRVALCRALVIQPSIILADEPTGNLDDASATRVVDALVDSARTAGSTVLIASHDPRIVARCDDVLRV